jgi:hypothetical protein
MTLLPDEIKSLGQTSDDVGAKIDALARLPKLEYEQRRKAEADALNFRVSALDREVATRRVASSGAAGGGRAGGASSPDPWPTPVDGTQLAAGVEAALRRFVVLTEAAYVLVTLWAIGTHAYAARSVWPLLLARSPQPACGKSTLLDVLERLVAHPFAVGNASLATLFRSAATGPTQLLDELDRWIQRDPEVVGFLCAGWQSGRPFVRCNPETLELQEFPCFGPKMLALIGDLGDEALRSRCVAIEMRRALPGERPERFRAARAYPELTTLQAQAARWAADNTPALAAFELAEDELPDLSGRAADNAEALLTVAEAIGGPWPERCREALLDAPEHEVQDLGAMLLSDLRELLDTLEPNVDVVATARILEHLLALEDRPWPTYGSGEKGLTAHALRNHLAPFDARPGRAYIGGIRQRAYPVEPIREAIDRYILSPRTPLEQVSQVSQCPTPTLSDALSAPETPPMGHWDGWDASPEGVGGRVISAAAALNSGDDVAGEVADADFIDDDTLGGIF